MIKSNQCIEGELSMNKTPDQRVINILNAVKSKLAESYKKYHNIYDTTKDKATEKNAIDQANIIIAEHKVVVSYLRKYYDLFKALYTPEYNGNPEIIKQINSLETEILRKYSGEKELESAPATPTPALEKGKKYAVTDTKKTEEGNDKFLGIVSTIGALILAFLALNSLSNIDTSSVFDALASIPLFGGIAIGPTWGAIALGKLAVKKFREANEKSKSK